LVPTLALKGKDHDPMRYTSWWPREYHSAVFVIGAVAVLWAGIVFMLGRRGFWKWWAFALTGAIVGMLPGLVYLCSAIGHEESFPLLVSMVVVGAVSGTVIITVLFLMLKPGVMRSNA
jgi:hypothetical protein